MFRRGVAVKKKGLLEALEEYFDALDALGEAAEWRDWESIELHLHDDERDARQQLANVVARVRAEYKHE